MNFKGKVVLVTGASQGIGRAVAEQFAEAGALIALHYFRQKENAEQTLDALAPASTGKHSLFQGDLSHADEASRLVDEVARTFGRIDVVVNNAGIFEPHPIAQVSYVEWTQAWERIIQTNLIGTANVTFCAARLMIEQGGGRIINVSSRGAFRGEPEAPAYAASKAAVNAMSQSLAQALAPHNIFVSVVAPGFVDTERVSEKVRGPGGEAIRDQSPLRRVARAEEVARTILFLASEGTDFLTGSIIDINGASYLRT